MAKLIAIVALSAVLASAAPAFAQAEGDQGDRLTPKPGDVLYLGPRTDPVHIEPSADRISADGFAPFVLYSGDIETPVLKEADNAR